MDLDDTLLTSDLQISEETKQTLLQCQKDGMHVILASGRPIYAIEKYAKELELEKYGGYIVGFNGAAVRDCKAKRMIMQRNLPMEYIKMLYNLSVENGVYIHTYVGDEIITPQNNQYTEVEGELTGMPIRETEDFVKAVNQEVVKVLMLENPEYLRNVYEKLSHELGDKLSLTISKPYFLEIMDKGIEKSAALLHICNKLGIKTEQLIAFGDSYNDLSMLTAAGLGIAMGNAREDVKKQSDYGVPLITDLNEVSKKDFDMACVVIRSTAVGGKGTEIAGALLEKGIHVIQEHPVHYNDIVKLLKVAKENNCVYQVNSFYPNVKNVQEFIVKSNKLLKKSRPTYIDATCSTQVLFPMISILGKALSGFHTWKLQTIDSVNSKFPFKVLSGEIRGIPAIVKIQNQLDPKDPDNNGFLLHRIVLGTTEGSLCLDNSNGLVIWNPQMYVPHVEGVLDMYGNNSYVELPVSEVADGVRNTTYAEVYKELWPEGIVCALNDFARAITDNSQKNIMAQQMLTISEIWKDLSEKIGSPQLIVTPERNGIRLADIAE